MRDDKLDDIYNVKSFDSSNVEHPINIGSITEKEKFRAAKQILLGLAILYVITITAYLYRPSDGGKLIDICMTAFSPIVTLILVAYFRDKNP